MIFLRIPSIVLKGLTKMTFVDAPASGPFGGSPTNAMQDQVDVAATNEKKASVGTPSPWVFENDTWWFHPEEEAPKTSSCVFRGRGRVGTARLPMWKLRHVCGGDHRQLAVRKHRRRINKHDAERLYRQWENQPDAIDNIATSFKSFVSYVGGWLFARGCTSGSDSSTTSDTSVYSEPDSVPAKSSSSMLSVNGPRHGHCPRSRRPQSTFGQVLLFLIGLSWWIAYCATQVKAMDADDGGGDGSRNTNRVPLFTGKKNDFVMWLMKLMAVATFGNFGMAIQKNVDANGVVTWGEAECPINDIAAAAAKRAADAAPTDADLQVPVAAWKRNNKAFATLALALPKSLFRILAGAGGLASSVMFQLHAEYMPNDRISHVEADRRYDAIYLDVNVHPRHLRSLFAQIQAEYPQAAADEAKKMSIIFRVAHQSYASVLAGAQTMHGNACTSERLLEAMETLYRQQHGVHDAPTNNPPRPHRRGEAGMAAIRRRSEVGMAAPGANANGVCYNCGQSNHRAAQCRAPFSNFRFRPNNPAGGRGNAPAAAGGGGRGIGNGAGHNNRNQICGECGGRGHSTDRCFCLAANASRRPTGWQFPPGYQPRRQEQGHANVDVNGDGFELLLCHLAGDGSSDELMLSQKDESMDIEAEMAATEMEMEAMEEEILYLERKVDWSIASSLVAETASIASDAMATMTFPDKQGLLHDSNIWLADSAASTHSTAHLQGMVNLKAGSSSDSIQVGNAAMNQVQYIGDIPGSFYDKSGDHVHPATLRNVSYSPDSAFNLLSFPQLMLQGWHITSVGSEGFVATSPDNQIDIPFDIIINTKKGCVYATCFKRSNEFAAVHVDGKKEVVTKTMSVNVLHVQLGHCSEAMTRKTAEQLGIVLNKSPWKPCVACGMGKSKQKNIPKSHEEEVEPALGKRLHADISTIRKKEDNQSYVKPNWFMLVDAASGMKFSSFWRTKKDFIEPTCELMNRWLERGIPLSKIRCDNAGENKLWEQRCKSADWKLPVDFEYTAARTPQQNSKVEVGFAVIANRGRSLMAAANIPAIIRRVIWNEAFDTATVLDGLMVVTVNGVTKTRFEHFYHALPTFANYLHAWGEAGVVKIRSYTTPKVDDRGVPCIMVGYAKNHPGDTFRMYNPATGGIHETRDVLWLRRMYYEKPLSPKEFQVPDDGILRLAPTPTVPMLAIESIDAMEALDVQTPNPFALHHTVPVEEEDGGALVDNQDEEEGDAFEDANQEPDHEDEEEVSHPAATRTITRPVTVTRSGRISRMAVRFDDKTPQEHDEEARERQQLVQEAEGDNNSESSDSSEPVEFVDAVDDSTAPTAPTTDGEFSLVSIDVHNFEPEYGLVGASLGGGFINTNELKPLKYKEAMAGPDKKNWELAVEEEKVRFETTKAVEARSRGSLPPGTKIMDSTWACKKKSNGVFRARLNLRGFRQIDGVHYDSHDVSSPVASTITIHIMLALIAILGLYASLVDVNGAFLLGDWEADREIYIDVPEGWEHHYPPDTVLKLLKTVYGGKQSAKRFWVKALAVLDAMGFHRSKADPCLYYKWHEQHGLILIVSWIDDFAIAGSKQGVEAAKKDFFSHFECDDTGVMKEYIGNKIDRKEGELKMTQPVLLQSFTDEFDFVRDPKITVPGVPLSVLGATEGKLDPDDLFKYRSGTGKLLHLVKWSRPEIGNAVRELSRFMQGAGAAHLKALYRVMNYCLNTAERGKVFRPKRLCKLEDVADFEFVLEGYSDSDYAKDTVQRRSVSGFCSFLEGCVINTKSRMQPIVALSVTEAELVAATECAQDLIYAKNILESIGLKVRLPIKLFIDNSGCIDLICNWSSGGRTRHMETRMFWLRELKEEEPSIIHPIYCPTALNRSDIYTKNCETALFNDHVMTFCTDDIYGHDYYGNYN